MDAIWLNPFYPSPMHDSGYDVIDYCDVDPRFGTLEDFDALVTAAADLGIRVIIDIVPNHCSSQHPWFQEALDAAPASAARERFIFRDVSNNWKSHFGGPAWTRTPDGQWYLHLFDSTQPDFNWRHPDVVALFERVLRFWLDRRVAAVRIDMANTLFKDPELPNLLADSTLVPYYDQPEVHELYRSWRQILDSYPNDIFPGANELAFTREPGFGFVANLGDKPITLPTGSRIILASRPLNDALLPTDTAVWLQR